MDLIEITRERASQKHKHTQAIIQKMIEQGELINYHTVAQAAGVSRTYLYQHEDLRQQIDDCRISGMSKDELRTEVMKLRLQELRLRNWMLKSEML